MSDQTPPAPVPTELILKRRLGELEIHFADGTSGTMSAEYLRVHSPSAEVTGHGIGEGMLVLGKENVAIDRIEPIGRYAVRLIFDDGHNTGLYTWPILYELCRDQERKWQRYLERVAQQSHSANTENGG